MVCVLMMHTNALQAQDISFSQFYEQWAKHPESDFFNKDLRNYFYDQSHFIKDFKRFTGLSPLKFAASENEFGRIFYRD